MTQTTSIYYDTQDPQNPGWAWRHAGASGPIDGDLPEDASLEDILDRACGSDVPLSLSDPSLWRPIQGAKGWEVSTYRPISLGGLWRGADISEDDIRAVRATWQASVQCESGRATGVRCEWTGDATETEVVEWMPEHLRETHLAAGNSGVYPHNGSVRLVCCSVCAEMLS